MNCKEIEKGIYLYDELTESEKIIVAEHVQQCGACKKLFEAVQLHQSAIHSLARHKPQPENYSRLTSNIMQAIDVQASQNVFTEFFEGLFVRYAFVAVSLALVLFFFVEQQVEIPPQQVARTDQSATVVLKTSGALQNLRNRKETKPLERITSIYACVKSGDCNNPLSKTLN
jgi:hypothetical protein